MKTPRFLKIAAITVATLGASVLLTGCGDVPENRAAQQNASTKKFDERVAPDVTGDAEYQNYIRAQEDVYDDPSTILWCTVFPDSPTTPIYTVPIAGKLTSSSVSFYPGQSVKYFGNSSSSLLIENQSVDGMYHGTPGPYRYGFTPGGQYWDFTNLSMNCTTALTSFQRQSLQHTEIDPGDAVTTQAEELLRAGDPAGAQALIDTLSE